MPKLLDAAIDDPSKENVEAYLYAQRVAMDKSQRYAEMTTRVVAADPFLDENNRVPIATYTKPFFLRNAQAGVTEALKHVATVGGLWVFFDSKCEFCRPQVNTVQKLAKEYGFVTKFISMDGKPLPNVTEFENNTGQASILNLRITPTTVLVVPPNNYYIVSQGMMAQDQLAERIIIAADSNNLLPKDIAQKINTYDRGVLTNEDTQKGASDDPKQWVKYLKDKLEGRYEGAEIMRNKLKQLVSLLLVATLTMVSVPASAGLADALDGMFMSNSTSGGAFTSQSRGGMVGGGAALRSPVRNINLVAFDPPRFSAGCGGIDMFAGSFSFINADALVALFRQIAANAVGVAFKAAIDAINPALGKLMQDFQNKLQALNQMMKNTCAVANSIVKSFTDPSARKEMVDQASTAASAATGSFSDLFAGLSDLFSSPNSSSDKGTNDGSCEECGNPVWKALTDTSSGQYLGNPDTGEADSNLANEVVMSMIGAVVMTAPDSSSKNSDGSEKPKVGQIYSPTLTLMNFKNGSSSNSTPLKILHCNNGYDRNKCTNINPNKTLSFDGTLGYTNKMLLDTHKVRLLAQLVHRS